MGEAASPSAVLQIWGPPGTRGAGISSFPLEAEVSMTRVWRCCRALVTWRAVTMATGEVGLAASHAHAYTHMHTHKHKCTHTVKHINTDLHTYDVCPSPWCGHGPPRSLSESRDPGLQLPRVLDSWDVHVSGLQGPQESASPNGDGETELPGRVGLTQGN